ncbi:MAG TPA: GspE/PulE family protein [Calditerricola sp.]
MDTISQWERWIQQAVRQRASDVHLEPEDGGWRLRLRIDGLLFPYGQVSEEEGVALVTALKVRAGMDIGEKRLPQDGRFTTVVDGVAVDVRVSTLPTLYGEKAVLRLLGRQVERFALEDLGLTSGQRATVERWLERMEGMILVTGPTGSGKTTTLYAMVRRLARPTTNIVTLEDPVECCLAGVNQVQINERAGLTFAAGLRAVLRQDPDVILVGEIRDAETASTAVRAALTGHLILATVHAADAPSAATRLVDLGVAPHLVAATLSGVIAQRLVRRSCSCRRSEGLPISCARCGGVGSIGRTGVFELLDVDEDVANAIRQRPEPNVLRHLMRRKGWPTLPEALRRRPTGEGRRNNEALGVGTGESELVGSGR